MPVRSVCVCKSSWLVGQEISKAVFHLSPEIPAAHFQSEPGVLSCIYLGFICVSRTLLRPLCSSFFGKAGSFITGSPQIDFHRFF